MVIRETSAARANSILNQPGVGEFLRPDGGYIDLTPFVEAEGDDHILLSNGEDALTLHERQSAWRPGVYKCHIAFGPTCRGKRAQQTVIAMRDWMYAFGANTLWSDLPRWNRPVRLFLSRIGAKWQVCDDDTLTWEMQRGY